MIDRLARQLVRAHLPGPGGFELIENVGAPDSRARYLERLGREMNLFVGERVAVAAVTTA